MKYLKSGVYTGFHCLFLRGLGASFALFYFLFFLLIPTESISVHAFLVIPLKIEFLQKRKLCWVGELWVIIK